MALCKSNIGYYIPMSVIVALVLDKQFRNCQIPECQVQSVKNLHLWGRSSFTRTPFLYIGPHPLQSRPQAGLRYEDTAKIRIIFESQSLYAKKERKIVFRKPCESVLATFSLKIIKNMANCLYVSLKVCIFAPSEINSDAAVSNWAGDFGHPRRRLTRGVRRNVSAPFLLKVASKGVTFIVHIVYGMWSGTGDSLPCSSGWRYACDL